ncbi:hypothetical protein [Jiangella rhizosphaerae]|uniref:Uncharacterized protein n=1 Tax=Jiangella rhizosphaerae TaxID=2293569 RepID=A0A418KP47_9ACTN|nr:hypothetical protein [Jiangella rhizosphaerae]RIQ21057.1 hypothetical protein DY240_16010 [Jiangella rhizosphaerae]
MTANGYGKDCSVKWCDEAGVHTVHRHYVESIPADSGRWILGVNVVRPHSSTTGVELTTVPRHGRSTVVRLGTHEAELLHEAIREAVERIQRRASRDDV